MDGLPARVLIAILAVEHRKMDPGTIRTALRSLERLAKMGLTQPPGHCGQISCCGESPRKVLEDAITYLPPWAKKHLRKRVRYLDQIYLARVWPDPDAAQVLPLA